MFTTRLHYPTPTAAVWKMCLASARTDGMRVLAKDEAAARDACNGDVTGHTQVIGPAKIRPIVKVTIYSGTNI